jgi:hypothetical protein
MKTKRVKCGEAWALRRGDEWRTPYGSVGWSLYRHERRLWTVRQTAAAIAAEWPGARLVRVRFFEVRR